MAISGIYSYNFHSSYKLVLKLNGCDSFGRTEYDMRIINDNSTRVVLTAKNVLDGIGL